MKVEIKNKEENKLLKREEVEFVVQHDGEPTPQRKEVLQLLKTQLGSEFVVIKFIKTLFGTNESRGLVYVYKTKEDMEKFSPEHLIKRGAKEKKKPKEEKVEEEGTKPETPKEEEVEEKEGEAKPEETSKEEEKEEEKAEEEV